MESRRNYRTIVLSDIHLGTSHSKVEQVCNFLSQANCERLILNGDIIDGWSLQISVPESGSLNIQGSSK